MSLHPLAAQFGALAEVYERGRPGYPPPAIAAMAAELGLEPGARVLDLAAGTGKLTRGLADAGYDVAAVEPQPELRAILAAAVGPERVAEGVAEAIPFPDGAFAAITVADGFHWFDAARALPEMRRVLRPGGGLLLASTVPDWGGVPWGHEVGTLLSSMRTEHPFFDGTPWDQTLSEAPGWTAARQAQVTTTQTLAVGDYVRSMSWVAAMEPARRDGMLERIEAAVGGPAEVPVHTFMWLSARD